VTQTRSATTGIEPFALSWNFFVLASASPLWVAGRGVDLGRSARGRVGPRSPRPELARPRSIHRSLPRMRVGALGVALAQLLEERANDGGLLAYAARRDGVLVRPPSAHEVGEGRPLVPTQHVPKPFGGRPSWRTRAPARVRKEKLACGAGHGLVANRQLPKTSSIPRVPGLDSPRSSTSLGGANVAPDDPGAPKFDTLSSQTETSTSPAPPAAPTSSKSPSRSSSHG
jgi:hypothetical protein